jgi:hypothetical protein
MGSKKLTRKDLIELLCKSACAVWQATLHGVNGRASLGRFNAMRDVAVGDLALEISALTLRKDFTNAIGFVEYIAPSEICGKRYLLRRLYDNKKMWWDNCDFIRVANGKYVSRPFEREDNTTKMEV